MTNNEQFTPSVDLTIFPRINYLKQFLQRADLRAKNGRIYNWTYVPFLDDLEYFEPADGSDCLSTLTPFPIDLGPDVTTAPTGLYDLREDCGSPTKYNLNPLIYNIDETEFFPAASGSISLSTKTFPLDVGPDVTTTPVDKIDLRDDDDSASTINLNPLN